MLGENRGHHWSQVRWRWRW